MLIRGRCTPGLPSSDAHCDDEGYQSCKSDSITRHQGLRQASPWHRAVQLSCLSGYHVSKPLRTQQERQPNTAQVGRCRLRQSATVPPTPPGGRGINLGDQEFHLVKTRAIRCEGEYRSESTQMLYKVGVRYLANQSVA